MATAFFWLRNEDRRDDDACAVFTPVVVHVDRFLAPTIDPDSDDTIAIVAGGVTGRDSGWLKYADDDTWLIPLVWLDLDVNEDVLLDRAALGGGEGEGDEEAEESVGNMHKPVDNGLLQYDKIGDEAMDASGDGISCNSDTIAFDKMGEQCAMLVLLMLPWLLSDENESVELSLSDGESNAELSCEEDELYRLLLLLPWPLE